MKRGHKFDNYLKEKLKNPKTKKAFDAYDIPMPRLAMAIVTAREKAEADSNAARS